MVDANREIWLNNANGYVYVWKFDRRGDLKDEMIPSGGKISLTTEERLHNQDSAANEELCIFRNGTMTPVRLLDGTEDKEEIAANPNLMSREDMEKVFKEHWRHFEAKVNSIGNLTTLTRLLELARELDATVKQFSVIEERIKSLTPHTTEAVTVADNRPSAIRAVTP